MLKCIKKIFILVFLAVTIYAETKIIPIGSLELLGGQYMLKSDLTTVGGNFNLSFSPVISFNSKLALLPMFFTTYRGTKDVQELVGGGTLVQEYLDIGPLSLKFLYKLNQTTKLKTKVGYKIEYLKETVDEKWQKGLFDYNKTNFGLELEKSLKNKIYNLRISFDYNTIVYPNYASLITQFQTSLDTTTYTELSENAGKNVLDNNSYDIGLELTQKISSTLNLKTFYNLGIKNFVDQKIISETGKFTSDLRKDAVHLLTLDLRLNTLNTTVSLSDNVQYYTSNQNSYDAGRTQYIPKFYDFIQNSISPSLVVFIGEIEPRPKFMLYYELSFRKYIERLAQDSSGNYTNDKIYQNINTLGLTISYPLNNLFSKLSIKFNTNYRVVSSNMKYEKYYKYNYYVLNYFLGIVLEY